MRSTRGKSAWPRHPTRRFCAERRSKTLDADFHALLALSQASKPSVVRIRLEGLRAEEFCRIVRNVIQQCLADLAQGAVLSVQENRIRVRRLPVA